MGMIIPSLFSSSRVGEKNRVRKGSCEEVETLLCTKQVSLAGVEDITGSEGSLLTSSVSTFPDVCA